jgi:hypothetical protein
MKRVAAARLAVERLAEQLAAHYLAEQLAVL